MNNSQSGFVYANELRVYKGEYDKFNSPNAGIPADVMQALKDVIKTAEAELDKKAASEATSKSSRQLTKSSVPTIPTLLVSPKYLTLSKVVSKRHKKMKDWVTTSWCEGSAQDSS